MTRLIHNWVYSIFSGIITTISGLFSNAAALSPVQQSVDHLAVSQTGSSQVDFNGTATLITMAVSYIKREQYLRPLDNLPLTRIDIIDKEVEMAISNCEKRYQCPRSH